MAQPIDIEAPEKLRPLMPRFLERARVQAGQLRAALEAGDAATLREIAHKLRGTAGGYGFHGLGEIAARLEQAVKDGDAAAYPKLVADIGDHLARAVVRFV